jgi:hypothetical protein
MHRLLALLVLIAPLAAYAGDVKITVHVPAFWPFWWLEQPRELPAGIGHCPRAEPK